MKEFFKYFFAALAAMFVYGFASVGIYIVMMIMMFSMGGSGMSSTTKVEDNTVLRLRLNGTITDRSVTQDDMYGMLTMSLKIYRPQG